MSADYPIAPGGTLYVITAIDNLYAAERRFKQVGIPTRAKDVRDAADALVAKFAYLFREHGIPEPRQLTESEIGDGA